MPSTELASAESNWRDVYVAACCRAFASLGNFIATTTLILALQPAGGYAVAALIVASFTPVIVLAPVCGRLADRVDSRMLLASVGFAQVIVVLCLVLAGHRHVMWAIALMSLHGGCQALVNPTLGALTPSMVNRSDLPRASALNQSASMIGMLTGPAIAGVAVDTVGVPMALVLSGVGPIAIVIMAFSVRTRRGGVHSVIATDPATAATREEPSWRISRDPMLRVSLISIGAVIGAVGAMNVVDVFLVIDTLNGSAAVFGFVQAAWSGGMLAGTWLVARVASKARDDGALVYGLLVMLAFLCVMISLAASVPSAAWLLPLWMLGGIGNGGMNVYGSVLLARRTPEPVRGRAYAAFGAVVHGAGTVGYAAGGLLVEAVSIRPLVAGLGVVGLAVTGIVAWPALRAVRRERAPVPS